MRTAKTELDGPLFKEKNKNNLLKIGVNTQILLLSSPISNCFSVVSQLRMTFTFSSIVPMQKNKGRLFDKFHMACQE